MRNVLVAGSNGTQIPLGQISNIRIVMGPSMITSENGLLRGTVLMNVRGRDVGGFVDEAKRVVAQRVAMPAGYYIEWSGQYENQIRAKERLQIVIPIVLLIIFALLFVTYHSAKEALHVLLALPLVSSLLHVLIVTPVIFATFREHELQRKTHEQIGTIGRS